MAALRLCLRMAMWNTGGGRAPRETILGLRAAEAALEASKARASLGW